jgi:type II secretory pathway component PulK
VSKSKKTGFAIILVVVTLALLALLVVTFASITSIEKNVSRNFMDKIRARFVAQSGIEYALERLRDIFPSRFFQDDSWIYFGNDLTANRIHESNENTLRQVALDQARYPSFAVMSNNLPLANLCKI